MKKTAILIVLYALFVTIRVNAQTPDRFLSQEYIHECTYNPDGYRIEKKEAASLGVSDFYKIFLNIAPNPFGVYCGLMYYFGGTYNSTGQYVYDGMKNGWYIFSCNTYLAGYDHLYVSSDYKTVRLQRGQKRGYYNEYRLPREEDYPDRINKNAIR